MAGCAVSTQMVTTKRTGLEQALIVRSLERAVNQLDLDQFAKKKVFFELQGLTEDQSFAKAYIEAQLQKRGTQVVSKEEEANIHLKAFVNILGVDFAENLIGLPSIPTPFLIPLPELALYKYSRNRGYSEIRIYAFDNRTGNFLREISPIGIGKAKHERYTLFFLINFTLKDIYEKKEQALKTIQNR